MGRLSTTFTFGRNALKASVASSADAAIRSFELVRAGVDLRDLKANDNGRYNIIRDLISFTGALRRIENIGQVTPVGEAFERLHNQNPDDAWRWLLTRSLWLYTVPNGTQSSVNAAAEGGAPFDFFRRFLGLAVHISAAGGSERFLSFAEICALYDDDQSWRLEPGALFDRVRELRRTNPDLQQSTRSFLADLENEYEIPRDNFAALFGKAFSQTGLFDYRSTDRRNTAIALRSDLDAVLQRRVRFILDHPIGWDGQNWEEHLALRSNDLPEEVSLAPTSEAEEQEPDRSLEDLPRSLQRDLAGIGIVYPEELLRRFVAAAIAKRFIILTGLSGSGKTKLAQAFAVWMSPQRAPTRWQATEGEIISADRVSYRVLNADSFSIELENAEGGSRVVLPYALVREWVDAIQANGFDRATSPRTIREAVVPTSAYSPQLNSFEAHLKAVAFHLLTKEATADHIRRYEIVAVGPEWTSREASLGYADALNTGHYVRSTPIVDLMLRAQAEPSSPFFLILDEMNLAHVERYFADFLSALESGEPLALHNSANPLDGVPPRLNWPSNLILIGTVNVDDTTYSFSPKVLDRANCVEFRVSSEEMETFIAQPQDARIDRVASLGLGFASGFKNACTGELPPPKVESQFRAELRLLFRILSSFGLEFGYRTAKEIFRFAAAHSVLGAADADWSASLDAQLYQKILPKLNGSRRRLEPILCAIGLYASTARQWSDDLESLQNDAQIFDQAMKAATLGDESLHPLVYAQNSSPTLPMSFDKILRMLKRLDAEGFTSFAEA